MEMVEDIAELGFKIAEKIQNNFSIQSQTLFFQWPWCKGYLPMVFKELLNKLHAQHK